MIEFKKYLTDWRMWTAITAFISLFYSVFNHIIHNQVTSKITGNDLMHREKDVTDLKVEQKELKIDLKGDLHKIFRRLGRIEKSTGIQRAICDERHKKIDK